MKLSIKELLTRCLAGEKFKNNNGNGHIFQWYKNKFIYRAVHTVIPTFDHYIPHSISDFDWVKNEDWITVQDIDDKELVWGFFTNGIPNCKRVLGFYDAENNCLFCYDGSRSGDFFEKYEKYTGLWPEWAMNARSYLAD